MNKPSLFLFFRIDYIFKSTNFTKMFDHLYFTHLCGCEGEESWVPEITITSCSTKHLLVSAFILSYLQTGTVKTRWSLNYTHPLLFSSTAYSPRQLPHCLDFTSKDTHPSSLSDSCGGRPWILQAKAGL